MTIVSFQDAMTLFRHTVVQRDDDLIWVGEVEERHPDEHCKLLGFKMEDATPIKFDADPDVVLAPTKCRLGNINIPGGHAYFLSRVPHRQYRVGWGEGSVSNWLNSFSNKYRKSFLDMVHGEYPSFEKAIESAAKGNITAFDRQWSLHVGNVLFCGNIVGELIKGKARVPTHLRKNLECSGGVVA